MISSRGEISREWLMVHRGLRSSRDLYAARRVAIPAKRTGRPLISTIQEGSPPLAVLGVDEQPAPRRKQRQIVALGEAPEALWREQHHEDAKRAEQNEVGRTEIGEIALHQVEDDGADDRAFHGADAADHDDENDIG